MLTTIPFSGFYNSIHDAALDSGLESLFQDSAGDINDALIERAWRIADFTDAHEKYARKYAEMFAQSVKVSLEFESMESPREYNFTTDVIFCTITEEEARRVLGTVPRSALDKVAAENFTSRDGFYSFYSNDVDSWGDVSTWDHNQIGALMEALALEAEWDEMEVFEYVSGNGYAETWILDGSGPELTRLSNIAGYLVRREERNNSVRSFK